MKREVKILIIGLCLWPLGVWAYVSPGAPGGMVNDFAGIIGAEFKPVLEEKLLALKATTGDELTVVTIKSLAGDTIENYAVELFEEWGIGQKGQDNGVLLLVALDDRAVRIEVGYGLEPVLTDAAANQIIQQLILPAFRNGDYTAGVTAGVDAIITTVQGGELEFSSTETKDNSDFGGSDFIFLIFLIPMAIISYLARSKSWWAGGFLGGLAAVILGFWRQSLGFGLIGAVLLVPLGLLVDYALSKSYKRYQETGKRPWWMKMGGGAGHSGGSHFGGFGGGSSGGGGASGRW